MKLLITGLCGFVGSTLARQLLDNWADQAEPLELWGVDNLCRPGSELNRRSLQSRGVRFLHADLRCAEDVENLPGVDWVIDAAANPSVLAGVDGHTSSRQILSHNLAATLHLMEYCRAHRAGFVLLSTSRVYSIPGLAGLPVVPRAGAFALDDSQTWPTGVSAAGVREDFSTAPPVSLYGVSKLASEAIALEYGADFGFPCWINRCGVLAGAGQFGRADQGIFSYWIHAYAQRRPLRYIGYGGTGLQVRDCLHPADLVPLLKAQFAFTGSPETRIVNVAGGTTNALSLQQLSDWCSQRFGPHPVTSDPQSRPFDIPWMILDCAAAHRCWNWRPRTDLNSILTEIAQHAEAHPDWLELSGTG